MDNDFRSTKPRLKRYWEMLATAPIPDENKRLTKEFVDSCRLGLYGDKVGIERTIKSLQCLKQLNQLLPNGTIWHDLTKQNVKTILMQIEDTEKWGGWEKYAERQTLRKFVTWLRTEYGYPDTHPHGADYSRVLPIMTHAPEVDFKNAKPNKLKDINEIPTTEEIQWMKEACDTYTNPLIGKRDKAFIAILEDVGMRISGIGTCTVGNISFDTLGALMTVQDKTMDGEPIRLITSAPHLKTWLDVHPLKDNKDAPLWVTLRGALMFHAMGYAGMNRALKHSAKVHNKLAESKGLPQITRRIHAHAFRYYAQTKDMLEGMPVSIQCKQRGWSPTSKQPLRYSRVSTKQADDWLAKHHGLTGTDLTGSL